MHEQLEELDFKAAIEWFTGNSPDAYEKNGRICECDECAYARAVNTTILYALKLAQNIETAKASQGRV